MLIVSDKFVKKRKMILLHFNNELILNNDFVFYSLEGIEKAPLIFLVDGWIVALVAATIYGIRWYYSEKKEDPNNKNEPVQLRTQADRDAYAKENYLNIYNPETHQFEKNPKFYPMQDHLRNNSAQIDVQALFEKYEQYYRDKKG